MILFVDESGTDRRESPYAVLGGIAVPQEALWPFICGLRKAAEDQFGVERLWESSEMKAHKMLRRRRLAKSSGTVIPIEERRECIARLINDNDSTGRNLPAYAQSCRFFCRGVLDLCMVHGCCVIAAMAPADAEVPPDGNLTADYVALFRQLYAKSALDGGRRSLVVHDERDDSQCRVLYRHLYRYYLVEGAEVAQRVVPEPFFVKSHLSLGITAADLVTYVLAWGFRHSTVLDEEARPELAEFAEDIRKLNRIPAEEPESLEDYGIAYVTDLADLSRWSGQKNTANQPSTAAGKPQLTNTPSVETCQESTDDKAVPPTVPPAAAGETSS